MKSTFKEWLQEAQMDPKTALNLFGLKKFPSSEAELRAVYKKLAMKYHPDRGGSDELMKTINTAKDVLMRNIGRRGTVLDYGDITNPAETYKRASSVFKTRRRASDEPPSESDIQERKTREAIRNAIVNFFAKIDTAGIQRHLEAVYGKQFNVKQTMANPNVREKNRSVDEPWVECEFFDAERSLVFSVRLDGNTDHFAYRMRHAKNGFLANPRAFDFEWTAAVTAFAEGKKSILSRKAKYRSLKDAAVLANAELLLPKAKLQKLSKGSQAARKSAVREPKKSDFENLLKSKFAGIKVKKMWFVPYMVDKDGVKWHIGIALTKMMNIEFYTIFELDKIDPSVSGTKMVTGEKGTIKSNVIPISQVGLDFLKQILTYAKTVKSNADLVNEINRRWVELAKKISKK